jgi:hypothetical protein
MPTTTTRTKAQAKRSAYDARKAVRDYYVYVPLGAAQLVFEKGKELSKTVIDRAKDRRQSVVKGYDGLATRGEKLAKSIRRSTYTKRAIEQTDRARQQVKATARSIQRAAGATAEATTAAARKVV